MTQCYFISRKGSTALDSFVVDTEISFNVDMASAEAKNLENRRYVVQILDGELVTEVINNRKVFRYLVFDALVHLGRNICPLPLSARLLYINKFL